MKRTTSIFPLLAILATILIGGATTGGSARDGQPGESPRGLRRMLETLDTPKVAKLRLTSAARQSAYKTFQ